ncbi:heat shock factor 2-binding protein [Salarias fasciatus]|uniref:heat shock factor 2-binding protein n=1 Tax=Salarias fasciatus TaxID=181472 RepID=UPI0011768286|nr:heat shock factor 2-binding protein [Salarias fasciatus]
MSASLREKPLLLCPGGKEDFVRVRRRDLERLSTEVMQLREFLPKVVNKELMELLHRAQSTHTVQEKLQQECVHLQSRLDAQQTQCQREREEKLLLREQLWQSGVELQQQADFCSTLGSAACGLLWSCSAQEYTVSLWVADGKLPSFLTVAAQTLESFVRSLDEETKTQTEDPSSQEHQFVLALAGSITNIAAVTCGRDFLASSAHVLLDTLLKLLELMKPGVFPKLKVLMLMCLYNVSINVDGLKYISENQSLLPVIWTLLEDGHWEVGLHSLRLLQSVLLDEQVVLQLSSALLDPDLRARVDRLSSSAQPNLRAAAQQALEDLQQVRRLRPETT